MIPRLFFTPGEPAGVGPDLCELFLEPDDHCEIVVIADPNLIEKRLKSINRPCEIIEQDLNLAPKPTPANTLKILPVELCQPNVIPGTVDPANSEYVLNCLDLAIDNCMKKLGDAMVTGPVQKSAIIEAGYTFSGHTEYLQERCKTDQVIMMLATDDLRVALATTHLPLRKVPDTITEELLEQVLSVTLNSLTNQMGLTAPKLLVAGLNPHAGEGGHLGHEDEQVIAPAIKRWQQLGFDIQGPLPADTLFAEHWLEQADAVLAMYHDQGLPVLKHRGFGKAVNITLGLPIIRTSVDHGTALDLAGTGKANLGSLRTAIKYAKQMASKKVN